MAGKTTKTEATAKTVAKAPAQRKFVLLRGVTMADGERHEAGSTITLDAATGSRMVTRGLARES
jgi:hypothetical protein